MKTVKFCFRELSTSLVIGVLLPSFFAPQHLIARMPVPKMVKNGFKSIFAHSCRFEKGARYRADSAKKSRTDTKPKTAPESQKRNKNHFTPISEQACALTTSGVQLAT